jgi:hypothetical protein
MRAISLFSVHISLQPLLKPHLHLPLLSLLPTHPILTSLPLSLSPSLCFFSLQDAPFKRINCCRRKLSHGLAAAAAAGPPLCTSQAVQQPIRRRGAAEALPGPCPLLFLCLCQHTLFLIAATHFCRETLSFDAAKILSCRQYPYNYFLGLLGRG